MMMMMMMMMMMGFVIFPQRILPDSKRRMSTLQTRRRSRRQVWNVRAENPKRGKD
jgi:hypothetical protein